MLFAATKNYVAVTDHEQHYAIVLDVKNRSFYEKFRGFEKFYDEELEDYEEHEIEAMAFIPDESMLVYTNMFTSEVVFVDAKTGERKRSIGGMNPLLNYVFYQSTVGYSRCMSRE